MLLQLLAIPVLAYAGICAYLFVKQASFIYFPVQGAAGSREGALQLATEDARVLVSVRPREGHDAVIYFGGNAEDVVLHMPQLERAFPDRAIYQLNYRGYGGSTGAPSESAIFEDALALFDLAYAKHRNIVLVGRSLGSGVATYVASQRPIRRLILVTPYESLIGLAQAQYPYVPVGLLLRDRFESWRYAPRISAPTLMLAAETDSLVPRPSTERLHTHFAGGIATLRVIDAVDHNSILDAESYLEQIRDFGNK